MLSIDIPTLGSLPVLPDPSPDIGIKIDRTVGSLALMTGWSHAD
ncbi:MAG TPA: hypothetical protein VH061_12425 [Solirubrobacteraceae bacterium]|nr:hypothetical protein [Solirubrobacteraceae bacterium]